MRFKKPRGTQDFYGETMVRWAGIESRLADLAKRYGYSEIRTPIFEMSELFVRTVGEGSDIVSKEMYTFKDKKGRAMTLRPENTAPVMRSFLENGLHRSGGMTRFFYIGPMFRYDRPQAGRYRQFHQFGVEAIGSSNPAVDAEVIEMSLEVYRMFGFEGLEVSLNSVGCPVCRPAFRETLVNALEGHKDELCGDCSERALINPMRIFDCKECVEVKKKLPVITDHLCGECEEHFQKLQKILKDLDIDFVLDPLLVRGLDYYTRTAFEILRPGLGGQNALCGGGRYDGLARDCGGGDVPAIGFSSGIERLLENLPEKALAELGPKRPDVFFIIAGEEGASMAMKLAGRLRREGFHVVCELSGRAMKKQMKTASEAGARFSVFIGQDELEKEKVTIKNMETGEQKEVSMDGLAEILR
ncbi:MAG: histidine--tRNA ligase [Candidatus Krumholzibacteria bacterium]|nr:histidine--tRNA ligase [Candidatus Krumholzibacteria bacterium]